jgi:lipopolysaccharide export system protein LptC
MSEIAERLHAQRRAWAHPGSSHDRIVRVMAWGMPIGIGILAAFLVFVPLIKSGGDVSFLLDKNKVAIAQDRLNVQSAEYRGEDSLGRPFRVRAGSAVQKSSAEPIVQLHDLFAEIALKDGPANIKANSGRYYIETHQVAVDGPIRFQTADGYTLDTQNATVDLKTRQMQSGGAVSGRTPMGVFSGNRLSADLEGRTVKLDGNARLRIIPRQANRRK